jgi:hypothetical protein
MEAIETSQPFGQIRPMPTNRGSIHFRMRHLEEVGRWVIERHCQVSGWFGVHYNDLASDAFLMIRELADRCNGFVVCNRCRRELDEPVLSPDGVVCLTCKESASAARGLGVGRL